MVCLPSVLPSGQLKVLLRELLQETRRRQKISVAVGLLPEAVSLVPGREVPDLAAARAYLPYQLLGLRGRDARIVEPGRDQQWLADPTRVGERRDTVEKGTHRRDALITILRTAQVATVGRGVAQEGDEVADAHQVDSAAQALPVVHERGQRQVAAIRAAHHRDALAV